MELNIIHRNTNIENNDIRLERNHFIEEPAPEYDEIVYNKEITFISVFSMATMHCFFLSVFEGTFYWIYIVKKEKLVIMRYIKEIKLIVKEICRNYDLKFNLNNLINNASKKNNEANIRGPLISTIFLTCILLLMTMSFSIINVLVQLKDKKYNYKHVVLFVFYDLYYSFIRSLFPILIISVYEIMFFQMVVYTYNPLNSEELYLKLLNTC